MLAGLNSKPAQSREGLSPAQRPGPFPRPQRVGDTNKTEILNAEILSTPLVTPRCQALVRRTTATYAIQCLQNACQQQDPQPEAQGTPTNPLAASAWQEGCRKCQPSAAGVGRASQPLQGRQGTPAPGKGSPIMHSTSAQQDLSRLCVCVSG